MSLTTCLPLRVGLALVVAACAATPPPVLPTDLPPPEYEPGRRFDLDPPKPAQASSAAPAASAPPAPAALPAPKN